ncbi:MAG: ATP-binding cassette domain-containing protein [Bifidobacteriaceae bacterium]|jgi:ABC-2 type transport system ATP-binding protein|nr:ATP-binding cassette domain-containing protein [Bifidobacteriaceae bacterium]
MASAPSGNAVEIAGAVKTYAKKDRPALDGLDLEVRRGEIFGFLGPNGAGKTTAMRLIMGLAAPDRGSLRVLGLAPGSPGALAATGALIESPALYPNATGAGHLRAIARWRGQSPEQIPRLLDLVGLAAAGRKKTKAYSLGMKQRLGVATALLGDPELVVLDEPANGLDPEGMRDMRDLLKKLHDAGRTVFLSSHLLGEVEQVADRVGVIAQGRVVKVARLDQLAEAQAPRAVFQVQPVDQAIKALADAGLVPPGAIDHARATVSGYAGLAGAPGRGAVKVKLDGLATTQAEAEALTARLLAALVGAGVAVWGAELARPDLTAAFFALTGQAAGPEAAQ